jgi:hypothetical protein
LTHSCLSRRTVIMVAMLFVPLLDSTTHAWGVEPKLTPDEIKALAVALKAELVPDLKAELVVDLKADLKAEFANVQKRNACTHNAKLGAASDSNSMTGIFEFQKAELGGYLDWLQKDGWSIKDVAHKLTGDVTIIATKPSQPKSTQSSAVEPAPEWWAPVEVTPNACPPVYVIPARKHVLLGCCR